MNQLSFCFIFTVLFASSLGSRFTDCGSTTGQVSSVEVTGCSDGQGKCTLKRGTLAGITINFTSNANSETLKTVVHGIIASVPIPFPLPQPDACKTGVTCPVKNGTSYAYSNNLNVRNSYPPLDVTVRFELKDDQSKDMACVDIPCKIQ